MSALVASLLRDHRNTEHLLKILEQEIAVFDRAERCDFDILTGIVDYFRSYPADCHHPKEDLVFSELKTRDPELAGTMIDIEAEHGQAARRLEHFAALVDQVMNDQDVPRQALDAAATEFITHERRHIEIEETMLLPEALARLTSKDWAALDAKLSDTEDPLFDPGVRNRFQRLARRLERWEQEDQEERTLSGHRD